MEKLSEENKIKILEALLETVIQDHPEFQEEETTGWDVIENAKIWLDEMKSKNENLTEGILSLPDIRNKLSPIKNLITMLDNGLIKGTIEIHPLIQKEMEQCRKSIMYLSGNTIRCKYSAIISSGTAYMVCDEDDNIIGYADTLGMIDYDADMNYNPYDGKIEVINVDERAWQ